MSSALESEVRGNTALTAPKAQEVAAGSQASMDYSGGGKTYLAFSGKTGLYRTGATGQYSEHQYEQVPVFVVPSSIYIVYNYWEGNQVKKRISWLASQSANSEVAKAVREKGLPPLKWTPDGLPAPLPDGEGWVEAREITVKPLNDEFGGEEIIMSMSSKSAVRALNSVQSEIVKRIKEGSPYYMPVIALGKEQFTAQSQTNWKPIFTVMQWVTEEQGRMLWTAEEVHRGSVPFMQAIATFDAQNSSQPAAQPQPQSQPTEQATAQPQEQPTSTVNGGDTLTPEVIPEDVFVDNAQAAGNNPTWPAKDETQSHPAGDATAHDDIPF